MKSSEFITEKSVSVKQARLMSAAAHDPKFAKKVGIKQSVAKEFNQADKGTALLKKATSESEEVVEAGKKGMSAHAKEVAASRKKYELELDAAREKWERENGEKFHFGNAIITKKGTNEIK